ncbi:MAG TPA: amidohydrolase family protein [Acidimicrobiia bacterium]|nr:amidohydrolase family protein [Acidimicrobiia bacterium]
MSGAHLSSAEVRERVDHPIVDADGHFAELNPLFEERVLALLEQFGGPSLRERYRTAMAQPYGWLGRPGDDPAGSRQCARPWWNWPARNTLDRATTHLPALLYERLDELGIDFSILYPSLGLAFTDMLDGELCQALSRAVNTIYAEDYEAYADRLTPAALVPMHTPEMAVEEAEYAVGELGLKTILIDGFVARAVPSIHRDHPELLPFVQYLDVFALDSPFDYDPFWRRCVELQLAPVSHSGIIFQRPNRSVSNYMYNHINALSHGHEALCKALFMGGVTRRFPELNFAFLEGGVGWACTLYADMIGHWEKRNAKAIQILDPATLDIDLMVRLVEQYGAPDLVERRDDIRRALSVAAPRPEQLDDWWRCEIGSVQDIHDLFVPRFYFGCEADDPVTAWAFDERVNPMGARMQVVFGSDISHWDVPDMRESVAEAWAQVEDGRFTERDFRDFTFRNAVRLHAGMNAGFFDGTVCEAAARELLTTEHAVAD